MLFPLKIKTHIFISQVYPYSEISYSYNNPAHVLKRLFFYKQRFKSVIVLKLCNFVPADTTDASCPQNCTFSHIVTT